MPERATMTIDEVSEFLRKSTRTIRRYVSLNKIPVVYHGGGVRFPRDKIIEIEKKGFV